MINSVFVIIGTVIGAGFASGKEIFTFFNAYGFYGLWGLVFSMLFIGFIICKTLSITINNNVTSYHDFIDKVITKSTFINSIICNIINLFLLISFIIMVAGFAAYFTQEFNISYLSGATLIALLCFLTFLRNIDGIVKINKYFIPFLIFIILLLGFKKSSCFSNFNYYTFDVSFNWFVSSILYASYNLILLIPILISLKTYVKNIKTSIIVSIITTFFLLLMSIILYCLLNYYFIDIQNLELPTVYIASKFGPVLKYTCSFVILGAIFTTAASSGYGFLNNLNITNKKIYCFTALSMCGITVILGKIGFSTLLDLLYPILGYLRFC